MLETIQMPSPIADLEPRALWSHFDALRRIPRPSKREERAREYVLSVATRHALAADTDAAGNVVVRVPGTPGHERAATVVLQSHLDMVCEKNADKAFDFLVDPIELVRDGDTLRANGTTLGADNGIGVAAALMMATGAPRAHGPLELLFTVDEETGLNGAKALDPGLLRGRLLINLDSEEDGSITIGCAGGRHTDFRIPLERHAGEAGRLLEVQVSGLGGGHSGIDIHKGRANAIKVLAGLLRRLPSFDLVSLHGGSAHNAIPREATALIRGDEAEVRATASAYAQACAAHFAAGDPGLRIDVRSTLSRVVPAVIGQGPAASLLDLLTQLPHGELARSRVMPDLVESSANVAIVRTEEPEARVLVSWRSSVMRSLADLAARGEALGREHGATTSTSEGYPAWEPAPDAMLLVTAAEVYEREFGAKPEITAIHAGLECGIIADRVSGMQMISIGPTIDRPHSPYESVSIPSVQKMFGVFLPAVLEVLARDA
jgi:dipeptidase D